MNDASGQAGPRDTRKFPLLLVTIAAVAVALLAIGAVMVTDAGKPVRALEQVQMMPDGIELGLNAVRGGISYELDTRTRLQHFREKLPSFLPERLRNPGEYYQQTITHDGPTITAFLQPTGRGPSASAPARAWPYRASISDERGWTAETNAVGYIYPNSSYGGPSLSGPSPAVCYVTFTVPPLARDLTLSLYSQQGKEGAGPVAKFQFPNPLYNSAIKPLTASPATLQAHDDTLSVTLLRAATYVDQHWTWEALRGDDVAQKALGLVPKRATKQSTTWLLFQAEEAGRITPRWRIENVVCADASGAKFTNNMSWQNEHRDFVSFNFQPPLWAGMGAFRMKMEFVRSAAFPPDEMWTLDVDVPTSTDLVQDGRITTIGEMQLGLSEVGGPARTAAAHCGTRNTLMLQFAHNLPQTDKRRFQFVSGVDNFGRKLQLMCNSAEATDSSMTRYFAFDPESTAPTRSLARVDPLPTSVTVTVAATRSHFLEFIAEPEAAK